MDSGLERPTAIYWDCPPTRLRAVRIKRKPHQTNQNNEQNTRRSHKPITRTPRRTHGITPSKNFKMGRGAPGLLIAKCGMRYSGATFYYRESGPRMVKAKILRPKFQIIQAYCSTSTKNLPICWGPRVAIPGVFREPERLDHFEGRLMLSR